MSQLNWAKLIAEGRAKAYGIPWTEEERQATLVLKIPADYVRQGILNLDDYEKAIQDEIKSGKTPLHKRDRDELYEMAKNLGVKLTPDVPKNVLIEEIEKRQELKDKEFSQMKALNEAKRLADEDRAELAASKQLEEEKAARKLLGAKKLATPKKKQYGKKQKNEHLEE